MSQMIENDRIHAKFSRYEMPPMPEMGLNHRLRVKRTCQINMTGLNAKSEFVYMDYCCSFFFFLNPRFVCRNEAQAFC